jgi:hypothetical protein
MKINLNDNCSVVLAVEGAEHINQINTQANLRFDLNFKVDWKEGDIYRGPLWALMELFGSSLGLGTPAPFVNCELEIINANK